MDETSLQKFSELAERDVETIRAEIEGLMEQEGLTEQAAFAVWKANNSMVLRSGKPQDIVFRVLGRSLPRARTIDTGESKVADLDVIYKDEDGQLGWGYTSLWGDRADLASEVEVDKCYTGRARFSYQATRVKMNAFEISGEADDDAMPTVEEIAEDWEIGTLEDIEDFAGNTELFEGIVGRVILSNDTGEAIGFEMASDMSLPVTVWGGRGRDVPPVPEVQALLNDLNIGDELLVYGYVNARADGSISLSAGGVWRVEEA